MKTQNKRIATILNSTLRNMTKSGTRHLAVPMSAAFLLAGCANFDQEYDVDGQEQELMDNDLAEAAMIGGDKDQVLDEAPVADTQQDIEAEEAIEELPEEVVSYDDGLDFVPEDLQAEDHGVSAEEMFRDWQVRNNLYGSASPDEISKDGGNGEGAKFDACGASTTGCLVTGKLIGRAACAADLIAVIFGQAEFVPTLSAACYTAIIATTGTCVTAGGFCGGELIKTVSDIVYHKPEQRNLTEAGDNWETDTEASLNCPGNERAKKVTIWKQVSGGQYVTRVSFQCTDDSTISFGKNAASDLVAAATCNQDKGKLLSGLRVRHGQWIDAVGGRCQSAGFADINTKSEYPVTNYATFGGTGGTLETFECPAHQYVRGMKAHYKDIPGVGKVLTYMRLHCR
ncbi:MAG: hypothetical protein IPK82_34415 [Polyangiaceae bacterium]|nr:hypothetical protein [Polyangiaceae bacterium]